MKLWSLLLAGSALGAKSTDRIVTNIDNWEDDITAPEWWDNHPAWKVKIHKILEKF